MLPEGIRLVSGFGESRDLVLTPSRSDLVVQSSRFAVLVQNREILNLSMVSGPVFKKIKGKSWILIIVGSKKLNKNGKVERNQSNLGLRSSKPVQKNAEGRRG